MTTIKQCRDKQYWDDFILENNGHPLQLWGWGELKSAHGWNAYRLFMYDDENKIIGAAQLLTRCLPWPFKSIAYAPRGPVFREGDRQVLLTELSKYVKQTFNSVVLTIEPDSEEYEVPDSWIKSKNHILPSRTIVLDLNKSEDVLLKDMAKKTRQYIRKSQNENMVVRILRDRAELDKCLEIYHDTAKRAAFNLHEDQYYYDVFDKLGDYSPVFAAYVDGKPIAFLWLVISADTAYELYGGMNDLGQQLRANYALKWYAIQKCKEWELTRYDFGGLLDGGVTTFKKGWAENETELVGTYDYPLSIFYNVWCKVLPSAKSIVRKIKSIFKH